MIPSGDTADEQVLLCVRRLQKSFGGQKVLDGVSVQLRQGEVVLLRGANGSGKTTFLNILTGNLESDAGVIELFTKSKPKEFQFPRRWWQQLNPWSHFTPEQMAQLGIGRTWQDIRLFNTQTLADNIAVATPGQLGENPLWALFRRDVVRKQEYLIRRDSQARLEKLGLADRGTSSADRVSLGQSKRVALARAVQAGAKILCLDEPLSGLDAPGIAEVMQLLNQLVCEGQVTPIIVEHVFNIPRILDLATTVWTLAEGKITVETPAQITNQDSGASGIVVNKYSNIRSSLTPKGRKYQIEMGVQDWLQEMAGVDGKIEHQQLPGGARLSLIVTEKARSGSATFEVEDLIVYRGQRLVIGQRGEQGQVQGLSFALHQGVLAILQAPNGWGKTTLLEAIAGLLPIRHGVIKLEGNPIQHLPPWERVKLGLSMLQARDNIFPRLTVREALRLAHVSQIPENIKNLLSKRVSALSGGERQKVALVCAINRISFKVAILDEPYSALDPSAITYFSTRLAELSREVAGVLVCIPSNIGD